MIYCDCSACFGVCSGLSPYYFLMILNYNKLIQVHILPKSIISWSLLTAVAWIVYNSFILIHFNCLSHVKIISKHSQRKMFVFFIIFSNTMILYQTLGLPFIHFIFGNSISNFRIVIRRSSRITSYSNFTFSSIFLLKGRLVRESQATLFYLRSQQIAGQWKELF